MSYGHTMIDDLPDLDDIENDNQAIMGPRPTGIKGPPQSTGLTVEQRERFIRNPHRPLAQAGMTSYVPLEEMYHGGEDKKHLTTPPPTAIEPYHYTSQINCIEIAEHIKHCPICSKFYNTDKTIFIIMLVVLSIICILLLKRVLEL